MSFEEPFYVLLHLAAFSFMMSLAFSGFMISAGLLDKPVERSNHDAQIPTAGGIGIVAGIGAGFVALAVFYPVYADHGVLGAIAALILGTALVGLVDDIYDLPALVKFMVMLVIAAAAVVAIGPPTALPFSVVDISIPTSVGIAGAMLWLFVVMNGVNFMDGSNGLMSGFMVVAFLALAIIAALVDANNSALMATIMAASIAGFLPYNTRKTAHVFSGDVGALTVGFGFAACSLLLVSETDGNGLLYVGPVLILPFLTDILMTMLVRARRKENLLAAHSSHIYQRLIRAGYSHVNVAIYYTTAAITAGLTAMIGLHSGLIRSVYFLALLTCLWVAIYLLIHRKYPSAGGQPRMQPDP